MPLQVVNAAHSPADVAVVVQTVLRPSLLKAIRSVFTQDFSGRIHLLIGVDVHQGDAALLDRLAGECPSHVAMTVLDPGYSTSRRHGGIYPNYYGGSLRTVLSYLANSQLVAYLDDNDWYGANHLALLSEAIKGRDWAWSGRWLVHPDNLLPICRDEWDSVGTRPGINSDRYGGFVQPSGLMMDKEACHFVLPFWSFAAFPDGSGEDRLVFNELNGKLSGGATGQHSCFCTLSDHALHGEHHQKEFLKRGLTWTIDREKRERMAALLEKARDAAMAADWSAVKTAAAGLLKIHPNHPEAHFLMGRQSAAQGRRDDALKSLSIAVGLDDSRVEWLDALADLYDACHKRKSAGAVRETRKRRFADTGEAQPTIL